MYRFYTDYSDTILGMAVHAQSVNPYQRWNSEAVGVTVQVQGQPVNYEPNDATYRIRIWKQIHNVYHHSDLVPVLVPDMFTDEDMAVEFSISPTEDPIDLERRYGAILKKYDVTKIESVVDQPFRAPKKRQSYIDNFVSRIQSIIDSSQRERDPMENGHVTRRHKGYSHCNMQK